MHAISSYRGNRHRPAARHKHRPPSVCPSFRDRQDLLQYTAPLWLARSVIKWLQILTVVYQFAGVITVHTCRHDIVLTVHFSRRTLLADSPLAPPPPIFLLHFILGCASSWGRPKNSYTLDTMPQNLPRSTPLYVLFHRPQSSWA